MKIKSVTAAALSLLMLSGCSSGSNSGSSSDDGVIRLTVWASQESQQYVKRMCEAFAQANEGKQYEFRYGVVSEADAKSELLKDISAGADVFAFASDQTAELVDAGALYRITLNKDEIEQRNTAASISAATVGGELYGYPYVSDTYFMYYDSSKLTEEEIGSLETILAKEIPGTPTNFALDIDNGWYQCSFFFAAGCTLFGENGTDPTQCSFNNERGLLAGEYMLGLVNHPKYASNYDDALVKAGFTDGTLAAAVSGTWNANEIRDALGENYAAAKLPRITLPNGEEVQLGSMANFKLIGVNTETKQPLEAMALADWLTNYENQLIQFNERSLAPTNLELANNEEALSQNAAVYALAQQSQYATVQASIPQISNYWIPAEAFGQDMTAGKITIENLQSKLDKLVSSTLSTLG
ncbi:MAG: extracellular solute-binding protein [Oscillospiraceae bacterium]